MKPRTLNEKDLRALRIFCVVAQSGGFSAAEKSLNMTKATISRQIKSIEETLGTALCTRGPKGFELTAAGESALLYAREALGALDRIFPAMDASRGVISGPLVMGITDNVISHSASHLQQALRALRQRAPQVQLSLSVMTASQLIQALLDRRLDIAIKGVMDYQKTPSLHYAELFAESHELRARQLPLVYRAQQPFVEDALARLHLNRGPEAVGIEAVAMLIAAGDVVGILPHHYAQLMQSCIPLVRVPDSPTWTVTHYAVTHAAYPQSPAAEQMIAELRRAQHIM
jgi:LysR family transcriptional regulator, transcriptional activator for bauABCD operon